MSDDKAFAEWWYGVNSTGGFLDDVPCEHTDIAEAAWDAATSQQAERVRELEAEVEKWKTRAELMLCVADYELRKKILEGRWP